MIRVLSLGAGVQSTTLLLMSIRGDLPRVDHAIFADTQFEPKAVYSHLEWLRLECERAGIPLHLVTAGNLKDDALEFRQHRKSADGRRFASLPMFVKNPDGTDGKLPRQCTSEYKIEPIEKEIRRTILGLKPKQAAPKDPVVEQWMGISADEAQRARHPGVYRTAKKKQKNLFGEEIASKAKKWHPTRWKVNTYPLLNLTLTPDRRSRTEKFLPRDFGREDCLNWLREYYPDRVVPRSACLCCPFRSDEEWAWLKENHPDDFAEAVAFDYQVRLRPEPGLTDGRKKSIRKPLVGTIYTHRSLIPLDLVEFGTGGGRETGVRATVRRLVRRDVRTLKGA